MEDYIKIEKEFFNLLHPGDYIRWEKVDSDEITRGAVIEKIGKYEDRYNWNLRIGELTFSLYWDNVKFVYLRKNIQFEILNRKVEILSSNILFLIKELKLSREFVNHNKKVSDVMEKKKLRKTKSLKSMRNSKN